MFQGHVYSLIGAAGDNRFALMHAGYKHSQGIDGFPKDLDMAYSYYSNAAAQTSMDSLRIHEDNVSLNKILLILGMAILVSQSVTFSAD